MSLFDIDTDKLVKQLLPTALRTPFNQRFLNAMVKPLKILYALFMDFSAAARYDISHTSQTCRMEGVLNDTFDALSRHITITDAPITDPLYLFRRVENKPRYIRKSTESQHQYIYTRAETWYGAADFYVNVPAAIPFDSARMNSLVKKYKLPGRSFEIKTI